MMSLEPNNCVSFLAIYTLVIYIFYIYCCFNAHDTTNEKCAHIWVQKGQELQVQINDQWGKNHSSVYLDEIGMIIGQNSGQITTYMHTSFQKPINKKISSLLLPKNNYFYMPCPVPILRKNGISTFYTPKIFELCL